MNFENIMLVITAVLVVAMIILWILNCKKAAKKSGSTGVLLTVSVLGVLIIVICSMLRFGAFEVNEAVDENSALMPVMTQMPEELSPSTSYQPIDQSDQNVQDVSDQNQQEVLHETSE